MNDSASLGDTIRDRRLALGYSLGQLATKVNKTASAIRAWERGDAVPTDDESGELAAALDLDSAHLLSLGTSKKVWDSEEVEAVDVDDPWPDGEPSKAATSSEAEAVAEEDAVQTAADDAAQRPEASEDTESNSIDTPDAEELTEVIEEPTAETEPEVDPSTDPDEFGELFEAKTEAVPVVPATSVAVAQPKPDPALSATSAQPVERRNDNPVVAAWDDLRALYYRIFDPRRRWIYRVRYVLILIAFFIMLRVLGWAVSNLWDAIGEVLDSVSFSPGETPDVEN